FLSDLSNEFLNDFHSTSSIILAMRNDGIVLPIDGSLSFGDCISRKCYRIMNLLLSFCNRNYYSSWPVFFFDPLDLEMTRVTIITSNTNMTGSLITVYALSILRIVIIQSEVLVHVSVCDVGFA